MLTPADRRRTLARELANAHDAGWRVGGVPPLPTTRRRRPPTAQQLQRRIDAALAVIAAELEGPVAERLRAALDGTGKAVGNE